MTELIFAHAAMPLAGRSQKAPQVDMRHARLISIPTMPPAAAAAEYGPEYRALLPLVYDMATGMPLDAGIDVALLLNDRGEPVGFATTDENGVASPLRYDMPETLGRTRSILQPSNKGLGTQTKAPEEQLVRQFHRGFVTVLAPEVARLMPDDEGGVSNKGAVAWLRRKSLRLANMVARAVVAECLANSNDRTQLGPLYVARRHVVSLRAALAQAILPATEESRRRAQLTAQCPVVALVPSSLSMVEGKKLRDVVKTFLKLPDGAERIVPAGVGALAHHLLTTGKDLNPSSVKWLSAELLKALPPTNYRQRLVLDTCGRVWQACRDDDFVEQIGRWLSQTIAKETKSNKDFRLDDMTPIVDWLLIPAERVAELRELYSNEAPEVPHLSSFDPGLTINAAFVCALTVTEALRLEADLIHRRMLTTHKEDMRVLLKDRLKRLAEYIAAPSWSPQEGILPKSVWSLVRLTTEADMIEEGVKQHHCVGTWANNAREGKVAVFSIRRAITKRDKGERILKDAHGEQYVCGGTIAFGLHDGRLRIVEFRGVANGPPISSAAAVISKNFPKH